MCKTGLYKQWFKEKALKQLLVSLLVRQVYNKHKYHM